MTRFAITTSFELRTVLESTPYRLPKFVARVGLRPVAGAQFRDGLAKERGGRRQKVCYFQASALI
jgi:hypothetical protein